MYGPGHYPPPDFSSPPPAFIQPPAGRQSGFQPGMWSWTETPTEPSEPDWYHHRRPGHWYQQPRDCRGHSGQNFGRPHGGRANYSPNNQQGRKQRNSREPQFSHFCDTCDRGFKDQEKYQEHLSQHVKCSEPDCSFMAHEKIVSFHWKNNHTPGAKRIKLDTPEEIAKWREERRKNYPTLENIERKRKIMEVREETGGVLETAQFGRMRGRGRGRGHMWNRRGRHPQVPHPAQSVSPLNLTPSPTPFSQSNRKGDPLGVLASSDHDSDREDEASKPRITGVVVAPKRMSSALGSLMANYESTSESEEEPDATPIQRAKELVQENQSLLNKMTSNPESRGTFRDPETSSEQSQPESRPHRRGRWDRGGKGGRRGRHQEAPQPRRPTLLAMLLAPDIRHERNVLLQCVRFVVRNHFFGLENKSEAMEGQDTADKPTEKQQGDDRNESLNTSLVDAITGQTVASAANKVEEDQSTQSEEPGLELRPNNEETSPRTSPGPSPVLPPSSSIYDDEIWETPATLL